METDMESGSSQLPSLLDGRSVQAPSDSRTLKDFAFGSEREMRRQDFRLKRLETITIRKFRAGKPMPRPTRPTSGGTKDLEYISKLDYVKTTPTIGGRTVTQVALLFDRPADQRNWDSAKVYVRGYLGNSNFVQMMEAKSSPAILMFEATGETLTIAASSRNIMGQQQDYKKLATVSLTV